MKKIAIHVIAHCLDCGACWEGHKNAKHFAKEHNKDTGHRVTGEEAFRFVFRGKKK